MANGPYEYWRTTTGKPTYITMAKTTAQRSALIHTERAGRVVSSYCRRGISVLCFPIRG